MRDPIRRSTPDVHLSSDRSSTREENEDVCTTSMGSTLNPLHARPSFGRAGRAAEPDRNSARIVSVIAFASIAAGAINIAAAATIARGSAQNLAFFWAVGVAQLVWGAVALVRAPRGGSRWARWGTRSSWPRGSCPGRWDFPSASSPASSCRSGSPTPWPRSSRWRSSSARQGWRFEDRVRLGPRLVFGASRSQPRC